jgi:hypothetical protein
MAKDQMLYLAIGVGALIVFMTDNPIKTALMKLVPAAGGAPTDTTATDTTDTTTKGKHKKGKHGRSRHSNVAYEECGY